MVQIAVTGGIACGKSCVADFLEAHDIAVCDADKLAHSALAPEGAAYASVRAVYGDTILTDTGQIDRVKLGSIVFGDAEALAQLNQLVHPVVKMQLERWLAEKSTAGYRRVAVVVPLLFEADMAQGWDAIICVACPPDVQHSRLLERGLDAEECRQRVAAQLPLEEKMKRSDFVIWNDGTIASLESKIQTVLKLIEERV